MDLSGVGIPVAAGDELAIVLRVVLTAADVRIADYRWLGEFLSDATYPDGFASSEHGGVWTAIQNADLGFRTYVDGPTPVVNSSWGQVKKLY